MKIWLTIVTILSFIIAGCDVAYSVLCFADGRYGFGALYAYLVVIWCWIGHMYSQRIRDL